MKFQVSPAPGRRRIIHRVKLTGALKAPTDSRGLYQKSSPQATHQGRKSQISIIE